MKGSLAPLLLLLFLAGPGTRVSAQLPFNKGVNLTGWFQTNSAQQIQFSKFTKKDFQNIKSLGCDVIRLPINLHSMTNGQPDFILDPLFLTFLDSAVHWAEQYQIHLILDNHTFDVAANTDPNIGPVLVKVWTQLADHYKTYSSYVYYEVLNEPHGIDNTLWGNIQQSVIDAIRTVDTQHYIVVGPADWNSYASLSKLPVYSDTKLIYTFHFYDPFVFTHQGASWTNPSMVPLTGVPFPYRASDMPATPPSLKGTWIESNLNNYHNDGTDASVKQLLDIAVNFKTARNVPLYCGEFGVYIPNSRNDDRVAWYQLVRLYLEEKGIPWTTWDYTDGFGLFNKNSDELFDYDLNIPLVTALGMNAPAQLLHDHRPETSGFLIYDDFIGEHIFDASNPGAGTLNYYYTSSPEKGVYCVYWTNVAQYSNIVFDFKPNKDMSLLKGNAHKLEFWVKGNTPSASFDIRFVDTKSGAADHPWRMGKTIDNSIAPWDGNWHKVSLSLDQLEEKGSYDNGWFPPQGIFDWTAVDSLEIVAEQTALTGINFWFDDIRDTGDSINYVPPVTGLSGDASQPKIALFPNPMGDRLNIEFELTKPGPVAISVYTVLGQKVGTISYENLTEGTHRVVWQDGHEAGAGLYIVEVSTPDKTRIMKVAKR